MISTNVLEPEEAYADGAIDDDGYALDEEDESGMAETGERTGVTETRGSSPRMRVISFFNVIQINGKKPYACQTIPGLFRRFGHFDVKGNPI